MKRLLISLLFLFSFAASAQVITPFTPQLKRKIPNDSIAIVGVTGTTFSFKLPDTSWVKKYSSSFFEHGFLVDSGTRTNPFRIAPGYITPAMLYSISGVPGSGTVYYGDGHWGAISGGGDSTIYKADGSITDAIRNVNIGANQLNFIAKSGSDSTGVAINNSLFDVATTNGASISEISTFADNAGMYTSEASTGNSANILTQTSGGFTHFNVQVVDAGSSTNTGIDISTGTGSVPGVVISDGRSHVGAIGDAIFPVYSGKQYAQIHRVDSIAKAKADSVKGTISPGGVTAIGVTTANGVSGTSSGGSTPNLTITLGAITPTSVNGVSSATMAFVDPTSSIQTQLNAKENLSNKATSFGTINNTLYPSVQAVNTQLGNYVPLIGGVTITGEVQSSYTPLAANDLARLTDLGLVPTVLTGMGVTVTGTTASIGSGTYRLNNITYTYPGGTVTISAQDGTQYRYSILYITTAGTISVTNGALVPSDPVIPDFPSNSVDVSTIYIPPTGNTITPTGGGGKTTGTVTNFSFVNTNGFTGSVANPTTKPALTLTLNTILPSVVAQTGVGTAGTDSVMVKHSGTMKAIAPGYYLPTSTASSTYALQSTTVSAGLGLLGGGSLAANRTLSADTTVLRTVANSKTLAQEQTALNLKANLASPALTGTPTAPTATVGTNTTQIATTAFVLANAGGSFTNPMTTTGDIIYSSSGSTPARLGIGSTNQILTVSGGLPSWQPQSVIGTSSATASTVMARDSNANTQINNLIENYTTTATAAGTTTLTAASAYQQYFTGTTTQTIVLPVASTLVVGMQYQIINQSTGIVTVRSSGSNTVQAMDGNSSAVFTCILTSGTSAASWSVAFYGPASTSNSGFVTTGTQSISGAKTFTTGLNLTLAQNGKTQMNVSNGSSGAAAEARISVTNNSSGNTVLGVTSSGYTPFGALVANSSYVYSDASAGLVLMSNGASVIFASGGNAEKMRLNGAGRLLVGTSTDNGTDLIQANGTIISGIDGTTQGAVKITGTSGTVSLKTQLATTTYNYNLPVTAGTAGQVQASGGGGSSPMTWVSAPIIQGTADLTAQTAAGNITTFTVGAATATFSISAYVNVTAIATDVIQGQITYTDENSTSQTVSLTNISAIGNSAYSPIIIRAKTGTVITVKTNLSTGGGTVTFDAGARITQL